jgi:hypothetical protein
MGPFVPGIATQSRPADGELFGFFRLGFAHLHKQGLDPVAGPRGFAQEDQARFDIRVVIEAADIDALAQVFPAVMRHQLFQQPFEGDPMQRIFCVHNLHLRAH